MLITYVLIILSFSKGFVESPCSTVSYLTVREWVYVNTRPARVLGIQYVGVVNFRYTVFLCLKLGKKKLIFTHD